MNRKQLTNLIGAGTIASLVLATGLLFGGNPFSGGSANAATDATPTISDVATTTGDGAALAAENAQLREALLTMQQREQVYQDRLTQANDLLNQQTQSQAAPAYGEHEEHEEREEHEHDRFGGVEYDD